MTEDERLRYDLRRAKELLREWRDRYGGREHYKGEKMNSASPTDLLRDTTKFLEGK